MRELHGQKAFEKLLHAEPAFAYNDQALKLERCNKNLGRNSDANALRRSSQQSVRFQVDQDPTQEATSVDPVNDLLFE